MSLPHSLFLVIFGASGDLTRRKLMPALIKIHNGKRFPEHFANYRLCPYCIHGRNLSCLSERRTDKIRFSY